MGLTAQRQALRDLWVQHLPEEEAVFPELFDFFEALIEANVQVNLFSRKLDPETVFIDHFIDCAIGLPYFDEDETILDFGCGGGLPGVILAICRPFKEVRLLDKSSKKMHYLSRACERAQVANVTFSTESTQDLFRGVTAITSRAVAPAAKILRWVEPFMEGQAHRYLLFKARRESIDQELEDLPPSHMATIEPLPFPDNLKERHMVVLQSRT